MRWARLISRDVERSLCELAEYLAHRPDLACIHVLFADMNLATARQTRQFRRIVVRLGFEPSPEQPQRFMHRLGQIILVLLLVIATNPMGLRRALRTYQSRVYLSRALLQKRYGAGGRLHGGAGEWAHRRARQNSE